MEYKQLSLFETPEPAGGARPPIGPATISAEVAELGAKMPAGVYLGTSSWSFPGWAGLVYDRSAREAELARDGLRAYAAHPLFRSVGIDRTYYAPISASDFAAYAAAVPDGFRFLVKAHQLCTFPRIRGDGPLGQDTTTNPLFLDPAYAIEQVITPAVEGLREKIGPIVFQFAPLNVRALAGVNALLARLDDFLVALPRGPLYCVELRNRELLTSRYVRTLQRTGAAHCFNIHPSMPSIAEQVALFREGGTTPVVVRWMLGGGQEHEEAQDRYAPFDRLVDEDPGNRESIADLALNAIARNVPVYVIANNKAEGSAPWSIRRLADRIVARIQV